LTSKSVKQPMNRNINNVVSIVFKNKHLPWVTS
ncbi:MAG: hypothetical protein QOG23_605, partial [Blastocatellia bacterium]|nr:hypothetical protein [Blastocatellia bacterium]